MKDKKWRIAYRPSTNGEGILELLNAGFGHWGSIEKWEWKYNPPTDETQAIIGIAEDYQGKPVGSWSILPLTMKFGERTVIGSQAVDAATHRSFRRKGIFNQLVPAVLNRAKCSNISVTYGIAQGFVAETYLERHGWSLIGDISNLVRIFDYEAVLGRRHSNRICLLAAKRLVKAYVRLSSRTSRLEKKTQEEFAITRVKTFEVNIDNVWKHASEEFDVISVRNAEYLNWRYTNCPDGGYRMWIAENESGVVGYLIAKYFERERMGCILDLLSHPEHSSSAQHLIFTAMQFFRKKNALWVKCWMPKESSYYKCLKQFGFLRRKTPLKLVCHINNPDSVRLPPNPKWFLTLGDCDLF